MQEIAPLVRKTILVFALIASSLSYLSAETEKVRISKIRIVIDSCTYEWKESGISQIKGEENGPRISVHSIISFLGIAPEKKYALTTLEKKCRSAELRLLHSTLVYTALAEIL